MKFRETDTPRIAAAKASFSTASAYRFEQDGRLPSHRVAERGEPAKRRSDPTSGFRGTCVMLLLRLAPGAPDDPVMRLDHRIRSRGRPLDDAYGEDGSTPVGAEIAQAIGEVAFALSAQPGDATRRDAGEQTGIRDCQDFRVWSGIMGKREPHYVATQGTDDTERTT